MTNREIELLIMLKEVDLKNVKVVLQIQFKNLTQERIDFYLDRILKIQQEINELNELNNNDY
jgi:phage terminase Nu1 subunit (DNA packaging protein)